jgi:hypothetical protein
MKFLSGKNALAYFASFSVRKERKKFCNLERESWKLKRHSTSLFYSDDPNMNLNFFKLWAALECPTKCQKMHE